MKSSKKTVTIKGLVKGKKVNNKLKRKNGGSYGRTGNSKKAKKKKKKKKG